MARNTTQYLPEDYQANNTKYLSQDRVPLLYLCVNYNATSIIYNQYSTSLVIAVLYIITAQRDNYILLFKDLPLIM